MINIDSYKDKKLTKADVENIYIGFINDLKLPKRIEIDGKSYQINSYNEKAAKKFINILFLQKYNLSLFFLATKLYYNNCTTYKKTLTNYILEGIYISEYNELVKKKEEGQLEEYVKSELKEDDYIIYKFNF